MHLGDDELCKQARTSRQSDHFDAGVTSFFRRPAETTANESRYRDDVVASGTG